MRSWWGSPGFGRRRLRVFFLIAGAQGGRGARAPAARLTQAIASIRARTRYGAAPDLPPVAGCLVEMRDDGAAQPICCAGDRIVDVGADVDDSSRESIGQVGLHQAVHVAVAAAAVRAAEAYHDALDEVAARSHYVKQASARVVCQRSRDQGTLVLKFDIHVRPLIWSPSVVARPM